MKKIEKHVYTILVEMTDSDVNGGSRQIVEVIKEKFPKASIKAINESHKKEYSFTQKDLK